MVAKATGYEIALAPDSTNNEMAIMATVDTVEVKASTTWKKPPVQKTSNLGGMGNPPKNSVHSFGLEDVQGVSPDINDSPQKLFLKTLVYDNNDQCRTIYTLPDGGNRALCII